VLLPLEQGLREGCLLRHGRGRLVRPGWRPSRRVVQYARCNHAWRERDDAHASAALAEPLKLKAGTACLQGCRTGSPDTLSLSRVIRDTPCGTSSEPRTLIYYVVCTLNQALNSGADTLRPHMHIDNLHLDSSVDGVRRSIFRFLILHSVHIGCTDDGLSYLDRASRTLAVPLPIEQG
jgi:hypothetical protein